MKSKKEAVLKYYPNAVCSKRSYGKEYYQIINNNTILGQGKSVENSWSAAYRNLNAE